MIKKAFIILSGITLLCSGCGYNPSEAAALTQSNVKNPHQICEMPDGRVLYCIEIVRPQTFMNSNYNHFVYYFGTNDVKTVSVNSAVKYGKTTINKVIVLDGKEYELVPNK